MATEKMIRNTKFQYTNNTLTYVRTDPDDYAQVVGICRKGQVVHAEYVVPGLIYKRDGSDPTLENNIWIKFDRGFVRRKSMLGVKVYFEEYKGFDDYPDADAKTKHGDIVMIKKGAVDAYMRPIDPNECEPKTHEVYIMDSSRTLALLDYPKGMSTWVWRKDLKMVQRSDSLYFSDDTVNTDLGK